MSSRVSIPFSHFGTRLNLLTLTCLSSSHLPSQASCLHLDTATHEIHRPMYTYAASERCGSAILEEFDESSSADVYANILGTSVMPDGKSSSITAPNGLAEILSINVHSHTHFKRAVKKYGLHKLHFMCEG